MDDWDGLDAAEVIARLGLEAHPEGGHYRGFFRDPPGDGGSRGRASAIYYLLAAGERSHWHRIDAVELWLHHAGAPLALSIAEDGAVRSHRLGAETPAAVVPARAWQSAVTQGAWSLVSCVVAPAFEFACFELAPPGWEP